jgi:hypothetical protein
MAEPKEIRIGDRIRLDITHASNGEYKYFEATIQGIYVDDNGTLTVTTKDGMLVLDIRKKNGLGRER